MAQWYTIREGMLSDSLKKSLIFATTPPQSQGLLNSTCEKKSCLCEVVALGSVSATRSRLCLVFQSQLSCPVLCEFHSLGISIVQRIGAHTIFFQLSHCHSSITCFWLVAPVSKLNSFHSNHLKIWMKIALFTMAKDRIQTKWCRTRYKKW